MKLRAYFKQHSVYLTKGKVFLRAILNHADKDTDGNPNYFLYVHI